VFQGRRAAWITWFCEGLGNESGTQAEKSGNVAKEKGYKRY
jgi:hypothetical protein